MNDISMKSKYWIFFAVIILLFISLFFIWKSDDFLEKEPLYVAVSGPMTAANGKAMVQGIQLYLDQINQQGGIHGHPVKLLVFDDQNKPALAQKIALEIATQSDALAVIGH
ncbi:branched chain amino acid ABC transporter (substrate-binding protein) [Candidatus Thiomargarita nelsonii]|uniref:Branched chain amino acid ABC transporter (Substrate-binding protein) n=1 Tax=Candidatus Thiomargarita nelsonii TaxID=1003181 RepID=A0A176RWE8_9GAMM|nr:branched chain amino acid ABC transporter (substrate-binding protein) [Candidatus Thiomargarita nelsonii]